jgi:hypothetical protein
MQRIQKINIARSQRNYSQTESQLLKSLKHLCIDSNKQTHDQVQSLKLSSEEITQKSDSLNRLVDTNRSYITNLTEYFLTFNEDLERTNEITNNLETKLTETDRLINSEATSDSLKLKKKQVLKQLNKVV